MESSGGDGQIGDVDGGEECVGGAVDLEETETTVARGREENLCCRMEANLYDSPLIRLISTVR